MKTKYLSIILIALFAITACDTDVENIGYVPEHKVDYTAIRAYKATDHEIIFGWFGGWNGGGASMSSSLKSLPDSMDMVSIWGEWQKISDLQKADMKYVQEIKGTKFLACIFTPAVGWFVTPENEDPKAYWGWDDNDPDKQEAAMRKYAGVLVDEVIGLGYDGIDMDNEAQGGSVYGNTRLTIAFIEEVGKKMGPASGTGRIFCVDGELTTGMKPESDVYINYYIQQAYNVRSDISFDNTISNLANFYGGTREYMAKKFIGTSDFELHATVGGGTYTDRIGATMTKAEGFAAYKPLNLEGDTIMKGGSGMYHIENDYKNSPYDYYYTRKSIQIMNPAKKSVDK